MSTHKRNVNESKVQENGPSWETYNSNDPNDSSWQLSSEKDFGDSSNSLIEMQKDVEYYGSKDLPLSIQSVFRNRSISNLKNPNNESVSKQAVKIASFQAASPAASGQTSHKSSLYKRLADKHLPIHAMKPTHEITKDACQESVESLKRRSDDINDELNKMIAESKQDESPKRKAPSKEYSERVMTSPPFMTRKSSSLGKIDKEVSQSTFHNQAGRRAQSKTAQIGSEEWNSMAESRGSHRFPWDGTSSLVKEKPSNPENGVFYPSYDANYSFKLNM